MLDSQKPDMSRRIEGGYTVEGYFRPALDSPRYVLIELAHADNTLALFVVAPDKASDAFQHPSAYSRDVCAILK